MSNTETDTTTETGTDTDTESRASGDADTTGDGLPPEGSDQTGAIGRRGLLTGLAGLGVLSTVDRAAAAATTLEFGGNYTGDPGSNYGLRLAPDNARFGLLGLSDASDGRGVVGRARSSSGATIGVIGRSDSSSDNAAGLVGFNDASSGITYGFRGRSDSSEGRGALGIATADSGNTIGLEGRADSPNGVAVSGTNTASSGTTYGVQGQVNSPDGYGLYTPDDARVEGTLQFTSGSEPHQFIFESGTSNPDQNVISHSPSFPDWGLRYDDDADNVVFQSAGVDDMTIRLRGSPVLEVNGDARIQGSQSIDDLGASVWLDANQTIPEGSETKIEWDTVKDDDRDEFDTSTHEFTCANAGDYHVDLSIAYRFSGAPPGGRYDVKLHVNGSTVGRQTESFPDGATVSANVTYAHLSISKTLHGLFSGDVITVFGFQTNEDGTSKPLFGTKYDCYLTISQVG